MKIITTTLLLIALSGCATSTLTGRKSAPIPVENVKVWFSGKPTCSLEEVAFISSPYAIGQSMMIDKMKSEAASLGADQLIIQTVNSNRSLEYSGGAIAARCH